MDIDIKVIRRCEICNEPTLIELDGMSRECSCKCVEEMRQSEDLQARISILRDNISPVYRQCTFDNDDQRENEASRRARKYVEVFKSPKMQEKRLGIFFYGQPGSGKTFLAMCIANALVDRGVVVKHTTMSRITNMSIEEAEKYLYCELLILDDVGTERKTETALEKAYEFVNQLSANRTPLILTSNYDYESLIKLTKQENVPDNYIRIYDRLLERCIPIMVNKYARRKENMQKNIAEFEKLINN